jgi:nucleoside diphosphate kinase
MKNNNNQQLAYVIVTPYSLSKSRTGGIISRLIARTGLELVAARMFAPGSKLISEYSEMIISSKDPQDKFIQQLIREYVIDHIGPDQKTGQRRRVMALLFKGENAVKKVREVVGNFQKDRLGGETIRDTYGDLIFDINGQVRYFEPAVLAAPDADEAVQKLKLWAKYSDTDGGVLENLIKYPEGQKIERTLVLLKPDNFKFASGRPGNMIDFFSRTGLYIIGIKVHKMSVSQAMEFYAPVKDVLKTKLIPQIADHCKNALENAFNYSISHELCQKIAEILSPTFADQQFENIVKFMSGHKPSELNQADWSKPGTETSIALIYEGQDAVRKIRDVLGPTDPSKAPPGSIRREFGQSVMVNAAHASDSPENALREMKIVNVGENKFREIIEEFYGPCS